MGPVCSIYLCNFKFWKFVGTETEQSQIICQNKLILIMLDNFDRKVCNGLPKIQTTINTFKVLLFVTYSIIQNIISSEM